MEIRTRTIRLQDVRRIRDLAAQVADHWGDATSGGRHPADEQGARVIAGGLIELEDTARRTFEERWRIAGGGEDRGRLEDQAEPGHRVSDAGDEDDLADAMRASMRRKLERNRGKLHWREPAVTDAYLLGRLRDEVDELERAAASGSVRDAWDEAGDVGNFAAMIADRQTGR